MIETILLDYLNTADTLPAGITAYMEKPKDAPVRYVLLEKTSGSRENFIKSATIAFQSYAESLYEAARLNEAVKSAMNAVISLPAISKAALNTDYNFTDPTKKQYRYQAIYDVVYYDE